MRLLSDNCMRIRTKTGFCVICHVRIQHNNFETELLSYIADAKALSLSGLLQYVTNVSELDHPPAAKIV